MTSKSDLVQAAYRKLLDDGISGLSHSFISYSKSTYVKKTKYDRNYFNLLTFIRYIRQQYRYDRPAHPFKIISVDPSDVNYFVKFQKNGLGQIHKHDWNPRPINNRIAYVGIRQRYEEGYDWRDTQYVEYVEEKINTEGSFQNYDNVDEFVSDRCVFIDNLYSDIKNNGYCPNYKRSNTLPKKDVRNKKYFQSLEPLVAIGKKGEIYWREGFHRFAIASVLNLKIPVYVIARQKEWQKKRDCVYNDLMHQSNYNKYEYHPDLNDILNDNIEIGKSVSPIGKR